MMAAALPPAAHAAATPATGRFGTRLLHETLPAWAQGSLEAILLALQILAIVVAAWLLRMLARRVLERLGARYALPPEIVVALRRTGNVLIAGAAVLLVLDRLGVSGTVLWTAFTGFAAVGAVAFFAAWSVLSNLFCTFLIVVTRPFRLNDYVELLENGEKPGLKGKVIDVNMVYTTLQETREGQPPSVLQIPNNLFFQRTLRRWPAGTLREAAAPEATRPPPA
jgi:small-conductance mechanosensitive channel